MTEQEELRASVRRFLADRAPLSPVRELMETEDGTDRAVWAQAGTQLGLQGLAIPQAYGGAGFTFTEQAIVLRSSVPRCTAARTWPAPCWPPRRCWPARTRAPARLLPEIASGETIATLAFTEDDGSWDPGTIRLSAVEDGQGGSWTGTRASCSTARRPG